MEVLMGGVAGALSRFAEKLGSGAESRIAKSEGSEIWSKVHEYAGNQNWELNSTSEGKLIKSYIEDTHKLEAGFLKQLDTPHQALWNGIKSDPALSSQFDYSATSLQKIDSHLSKTGHPLATHSNQLMNQDIDNATKTLKELSYQNKRQATLFAKQQVMGPNMENISPLIMKLRDSSNTSLRELGQRYADIIGNEFRDREMMTSYSQKGPVKSPESLSKVQMNKAFTFVNKARELMEEPSIPFLKTESTYKDPSKIERVVTRILHTVQTPLAFIPHGTMEFNIALRAPREALVKAMLGVSKVDSDRIIESSGILARTVNDIYQKDIMARTGRISKWTDSPTAASIIDKVFHMPLFHDARKMQIRHAGAAGFHSAIYWANKVLTGDKMALKELSDMHIDPAEVIKQGGQLTPQQLEQGVYHFTQQTMFLGSSLHMPLAANKNIFMRSLYMYHNFVRNEAFFLHDTLTRMAKAGDLAGIARFTGVLCIAWPAVAPLVNGLEVLGRTGSPSQAGRGIKEDYRKLSGAEGSVAFGEEYISTLAHLGAMGTFMQYWNATKGYGLAKTAMGPKFGTPLVMIQDAMQVAQGKSKKLLARDVLQLIPLVGKPLSHKIAPSAKEEKAGRGSLHYGRTHFKKRKKGW
jgi:hypothetical protein